MEQSIFKALVDQYQTPHPFLGVDGQAFPMIPYSMKLELIQNAGATQPLTMDDFVNAETRRVKQLLDAANEKGDAQLATRVLNELYPLMVEDVQSGNPRAVQVYSPVVNQMRYIIGVTQQPQAQPVVQEQIAEPMPSIAEDERSVDTGSIEPEPYIAEDVELVSTEPIQEPQPVRQEEPVGQGRELAAQEGKPVQAEPNQTAQNRDLPGTAAPKSTSVAPLRKKRTPVSAIVLFILGAAFILAFLLINAFPFIGLGTYEDLFMMGLFDIAIGCLVLAVVCVVVGLIILWRSKAKR